MYVMHVKQFTMLIKLRHYKKVRCYDEIDQTKSNRNNMQHNEDSLNMYQSPPKLYGYLNGAIRTYRTTNKSKENIQAKSISQYKNLIDISRLLASISSQFTLHTGCYSTNKNYIIKQNFCAKFEFPTIQNNLKRFLIFYVEYVKISTEYVISIQVSRKNTLLDNEQKHLKEHTRNCRTLIQGLLEKQTLQQNQTLMRALRGTFAGVNMLDEDTGQQSDNVRTIFPLRIPNKFQIVSRLTHGEAAQTCTKNAAKEQLVTIYIYNLMYVLLGFKFHLEVNQQILQLQKLCKTFVFATKTKLETRNSFKNQSLY
eukprot:TRINITY_DN14609_c0_g1_i1.p1 TRINITY_DN14609_c0_g1~~TRINITY_DN14609_c0_g1_i1.p1  ORF type:complete len:311 (-),score=-8.23 TRINITY_DN14609_c0_g1_i1:798-1730(-)